MKENPILEKSFAFSLRIIRLYKYLVEEKKEYILSKELLIAGTNIGKHVKASETEYWLQLLLHADLLGANEFDSIETDREVLIKMLAAIIRTTRENV
jgi:hypothetical protein